MNLKKLFGTAMLTLAGLASAAQAQCDTKGTEQTIVSAPQGTRWDYPDCVILGAAVAASGLALAGGYARQRRINRTHGSIVPV